MARFHVIAAVLAAVLVVAFAEESVYDVRPDAIHAFIGNEKIEICGCGFTKYNSVVCIFNGQWMSTNSWIVDDNTVICQAPAFPKEYFIDNLAQDFAVHVVYDNDDNSAIYVGNIRVGPQVNTDGQQISPQYTRRTNAGTLTISGSLFRDNWDSPPTVYFDDVAVNVSDSSYTDTTISVAIPNGKLNQNAMISVRFHAGGYSFYMKVDDTLRYGPWVTGITQTCVDPEGGTQLTVTGHNLDDTTTGNDGTLPLIIVSYYKDEKQTVVDKPNYNFQISLLANSGLTANSFTFAAPSIVEALQEQDASEDDAFNLAWGIYVEVDIYFDQSWARSTMETGEPLYFLTNADLQNSNLLDNIGDEQPQTLGYRYGGYIIQSAGVTVGGTRASTLSVPGSFAHFGGGDQVCIQFCGTNLLNKFGTVNNGYSWEFFYHYDAAPSSESICTSAPTLSSTDTFCCTTKVSSYANRCTNGRTTEFSATLTIDSGAGNLGLSGDAVYDSDSTDAKLANIYADVAYSSSLWMMSLGPQQVSTVQGLFGRTHEYRFDFANIDASTTITYDVYAAQYNRGGSTWPTTLSSVYTPADGNPTQTSGSFTVQSDTSVSVTVPAFDFDITNVLNLEFDSGKTCVNQYVHWGSICGPWYLAKDSGKYYSNPSTVFDNFDINDYGLSTNYVGLGTSTPVGITVKSGQNTGHSDRVILCARGSFTDSIEEGFTWSAATSRFTDNNGGGNIPSSCDVYQASTGGTNTATLPANNNILWADQYDVWQYYSVADDQLYSGYTSAYTNVQDFDGSSTSTVWKARTLCGRIRVGCTATDAECSSPYGPTQGFYELNADGSAPEDASAGPSSTIGSVTVTGKFMDETTDSEIAIIGYSTSKTLGGNSGGLTAGTQWNKDALVSGAVSVVCDICNTTDPSEIFRVRFGPQIISLDIDSDGQGEGDPASAGLYNGYDLWGASNLVDVPSYLTIRGYRFSDYIIGSDGMYNYNNGADNLAEFYNSNEVAITVFVDGVQAEFNNLWIPQNDVEVQEILVTLPTRPFGTAGVVKVYFGQQYHNPEEIRFDEYASNWGHYLIASQKVWYTPRIDLVDVTDEPRFGYAAGAHGLTEITATGLGFLDAYDDNVYCYLDDYVVPGEVVTDTRTVSCTFDEGSKKRMNIIPDEYQKPESFQYKFGAEFNTNVSFHIEFNRETDELQYLPTYSYGYLNDGFNNEYSDGLDDDYGAVYNSLGVHDLKVLYDGEVFHWGPICTATSQDADTLYYTVDGDFTGQNDVVISGYYMSDCLADQNDGDTILESPWTVNADSDNSVTYTYCQARYVDIYMVWEGVNGQTYTLTLTEAADSLDSDTFHFNSDDLSPANIAENSRTTSGSLGTTISNMECNFEGWFYVVYTDAHVTNPFQQNIYCEKQYTISAPYVTAVDGADGASGPTGWGLAAAGQLDDLPWFFGWVDNEIKATFSENLVTNEYLGAATCHWAFDGSSTVNVPVEPVGTTVTCAFPASGNWQNTGVLSISFDNGGDTTLLASCNYTIARFTYGPGVLHHNYCASPFGLDCGGSASTTVTFSAYGPTCCNLGTASNAIFGAGYTADRQTWLPSSNPSHGVQTISVLQPGTESSCSTKATLTSSSFIPLSSLGPIGVVFYKSGSTDQENPTSNSQCSSNVYCLFDTVDGAGYNQVCFGPIRQSDTELVRYTYTDYSNEASTDQESHTFPVVFNGVDDLSSDFSSVEVDFCYASGQCINDLLTAESDTDSSDTIVVDLFDAVYTPGADTNDDITTFTVQCGDAYNYVRFQFQYNNVKYIVKDTFAATGTATSSSPQFFAQTGNEVRITLDHRPKIKSVTPACDYSQQATFTNPLACTNADDNILRSSEYGNLILDVTISNAYDFYQRGEETESTENFGNFGVIAYLGSQDGSNFVSRAFITTATSGTYEKASEIAGQDWSEFVYTDDTDGNGDVTIRIVLPPGAFNSELFLHAEYNPHIDDFTSTDDDFLWVPYVTAVSKTWVLPRGHENLAYQGHGFTGSEQEEDGPLHTVLQVSNSFRTGVELQASCRIYKDQYITCLTPAFSTPSTTQSADIQFTSCDDDICGDAWTIPSNQNIDIVGTVAIAPQTISNDGGTVVYFPFYGMSHFDTDQIFCGFPDLQSVDHEWLFPVVYNSSNVAFNKPVYECFIPDILGLTVDNATVITTLNLYFQEPNVPKCDDVDQPFLVTLSTHPVQVGFPCAREAEFTPAANNNDDNTYSGFGVVVVPNLRNKNGVVSVRGDFFPEVNGTTGAASPVDFRCRFEYYNWRAYYDPENRDNGDHYHYRNVLSDLASGPNTYTLVVNGAVEVYAEQWDCTLPESNGDDRDFDVIVVTAVYRGLEDDNCHVVLLNSAAAFASSLVVLLVALAALF